MTTGFEKIAINKIEPQAVVAKTGTNGGIDSFVYDLKLDDVRLVLLAFREDVPGFAVDASPAFTTIQANLSFHRDLVGVIRSLLQENGTLSISLAGSPQVSITFE